MGQVLHGTATTTHAIREKIQDSQESLVKLAKRYGINPKTVQKWRKRESVEDLKCGSKPGQGSVLAAVDEVVIYTICCYRRYRC
jgi:transposase-like protein